MSQFGSRTFYARIDGQVFGFQDKRQRDRCGGVPVPATVAYEEGYEWISYHRFDGWLREVLPMNQLEKEVEAALRRMIEKHGGRCLKWVCPGWAGVPDRICLLPGGLIYFVETKRPDGGARAALQKKWAEWITGLGFTHLWVLNQADVDDLEGLIRFEEDAREWSYSEAHEVRYERRVK